MKQGLYAVYKPKGFTSRQIVSKIAGKEKAGHGGTLDPLAEGVLVVGVGREYTKQLHGKRFAEKEYIGTIRLGIFSSTDDEEGEKEYIKCASPVRNSEGRQCKISNGVKIPSVSEVKEALAANKGHVEQVPPLFSAVKIKGKEAYKWARKGIFAKPRKRKREIKEIELLGFRYPLLRIRLVSGPGVYVRTLARDIGKKLGTGGYLYHLKRIRVGDFHIKDCKLIKYKI